MMGPVVEPVLVLSITIMGCFCLHELVRQHNLIYVKGIACE